MQALQFRTQGLTGPSDDRGVEGMIKAGIIDPTKVSRTALQNAASVAGLMLTTEVMGLGTNTIEGAKKDGRPMGDVGEFRRHIKLNDRTPIDRIRTLQITNFYILLIGSSCIQVVGEPVSSQ